MLLTLPTSITKRHQRGIALIVSLILLLLITLLALAASRGTLVQQKMTSNLYDRTLQLQGTEAALRVAMELLPTHPALIARNCQAGGVVCPGNPFEDPDLPAGAIHTVSSGQGMGQYTASVLSPGQPQYVIEAMGQWPDPQSDTGFGQTANAHNYGAQGTSTTALYYRITARSGDPQTVGDRAVVTLQTMVKQR